jgi:hypothetical protein
VGLRGLGQPLKSFRDRQADFSVYRPESFESHYLHGLGPLAMPARGSRAGLRGDDQRPLPEDGAAPAPEPPPVAAYRKWVDVKQRRGRKVR